MSVTIIEKTYLRRIASDAPTVGQLAYRGQADSAWRLRSSATRRLILDMGEKPDTDIERTVPFSKLFMSYHRTVLIDGARKYGFDHGDKREDSDLKLLCRLQHLGAATGLIDFTLDSLVALWIATAMPEGRDCPGRVYVINLNDTNNFERMPLSEKHHGLNNIFPLEAGPTVRQYYYEPQFKQEASSRVLRQRSVFLVGHPLGEEVPDERIALEIEIPSNEKANIRKELEVLFGISEQTLFPDIYGFANAHSQKSAMSRLDDPEYFLNKGNDLYQRRKFQRSIRAYSESLDLEANRSKTYYLRGNAKAQIEDYASAISDYDKASEFLESSMIGETREERAIPNMAMIAFNRGNVNCALEQYELALRDYDRALQSATQGLRGTVLYNRGNANARMLNFVDAIYDYQQAIEANIRYARFNKGNALVVLGRFQEALKCYTEEQSVFHFSHADNNISNVCAIVRHLGNRKTIVKLIDPEESKIKPIPYFVVQELQGTEGLTADRDQANDAVHEGGTTYLLTGNAGNIGNFGGGDTKGGEGYHGQKGFAVRVAI